MTAPVGNDPEQVVRLAGAFAQGQREAGVFTVLKHFPGHGHADGDSHRGRVTTPPLDQLAPRRPAPRTPELLRARGSAGRRRR